MIDLKQFKEIKINGQAVVQLSLGGSVVWKKGGDAEWKLDENGYLIGADGKYYQRWYDDSHMIDNNPITDLNGQWVEDSVSGALNIDKNFDYFMSNSNYHVSSSYSQFKVSWSGLTEVTFLYRSYAESTYDYLVINGLDRPKFTSQPSYSTSGILAHTRGSQTTTYKTITIPCDEGEHFIWFCYVKDGSTNSSSDRAFVGVPNNYKSGELLEKQGAELHYEYVKSDDYVMAEREGYIQYKYYKTYYSPNGLNEFKTAEYVLGEEVPATPIENNYLRFDATTNDVHIGFNDLSLATDIEYSTEFEEVFTPLTSEGVDIPQGKSIWLRANGLSTSSSNRTFTTSNDVECHGDVRSLLNNTNFETADLTNYCFKGLFQGSKITTAPELSATTMRQSCYAYMFSNCLRLTQPPELPAMTLANYCYNAMFFGCSRLTQPPELPATTMQQSCYAVMFNSCSGLTELPETLLHSTTLANSCYYRMFAYCGNINKAPELPATTLQQACYREMFISCTSLTKAPELPATTLHFECYAGMFKDCSMLVEAPELPATTLLQNNYDNNSYYEMFSGCSKLNKVKCNIRYYKETISEKELTGTIANSWLNNVSSTGTFYKNPDWEGPTARSANTIPSGWTIVNWNEMGSDRGDSGAPDDGDGIDTL